MFLVTSDNRHAVCSCSGLLEELNIMQQSGTYRREQMHYAKHSTTARISSKRRHNVQWFLSVNSGLLYLCALIVLISIVTPIGAYNTPRNDDTRIESVPFSISTQNKIPDTTAIIGRLFLYSIPQSAYMGLNVSTIEVSTICYINSIYESYLCRYFNKAKVIYHNGCYLIIHQGHSMVYQ